MITIARPHDAHLHLRAEPFLKHTVAASTDFGFAIIMPNLVPPVRTAQEALNYRQHILNHILPSSHFYPLMALYLTDETTIDEVIAAKKTEHIIGYKLYPAGATTHSAAGVKHFDHLMPVFETMAEYALPLLIHGEVTDPAVDIFDRERRFIEQYLIPLTQRIPNLRIVLEHITTQDAVQFIQDSDPSIAATITIHHLMYDRNALLVGGIRPHLYCLPILKSHRHQEALIKVATSGHPKFFLGTDSAPHARSKKESACGCAGIFSAPVALPSYAEIFEAANALDQLEAFASFNMTDFYGLPRRDEKITLVREDWKVPEILPFGDETIIPFRAGEVLHWKVVS